MTADTVHVYRYVMKPTLPVRRDSPKKAITLVLAVLLGGMIGAGIVLGRNALRSYKPKSLVSFFAGWWSATTGKISH
ncbi:regulator of length of O-antigen component of lipopolysaccharide chains [Salmonella enterica subsp. enterica]|uniref:Regulator of length of O-antigen component of lipopolysaccharide chains n=1 Tax=Salmonella enterica I TaxID=59201 RepID=A0A379W7W2_SALET|nr:regulator of length of O-antigen component of lipopolysaccharide chains [Salmonella enterica subsp. enterica]